MCGIFSTKLLAQTTLRNVLGTKNLSDMLSERETISHWMSTVLDEATDPWGVKVPHKIPIKSIYIIRHISSKEAIIVVLIKRVPQITLIKLEKKPNLNDRLAADRN